MAEEQTLRPRARPMEVLVLGLCRTATMSTQKALEKLGYDKVYNYSVAVKTLGDPDKWIAALEAKFEGKGEPFGKEQWDVLLGDYNVRCRSLFHSRGPLSLSPKHH